MPGATPGTERPTVAAAAAAATQRPVQLNMGTPTAALMDHLGGAHRAQETRLESTSPTSKHGPRVHLLGDTEARHQGPAAVNQDSAIERVRL